MKGCCARITAGLIAAGALAVGLSTARAGDKPAPAPAPPAPPAAASAAAAPLSLTAKLVEIPSQFPPDELYDYAYVMRYEVVGGPLDKQSILVAHYKPRLPRAKIKDQMKAQVAGKLRSFKIGDLHKLELSPDLKRIWRGALVDDFAATDRKSVRYWALAADPA